MTDSYTLFAVCAVVAYMPVAWSIWHIFTHSFPSQIEKLLWGCLVVFIPVAGALAYLCLGMRRQTGKTGLRSD